MSPVDSFPTPAAPESPSSDDDPYQQMPPQESTRVAVFIDWPNINFLMPEVDLGDLIHALHRRYSPWVIRTYAQEHPLPEIPLGYTRPIRRVRNEEYKRKDVDPIIINDMWEYQERYGKLVLLSGDIDYWYTLCSLRNKGKTIIVHGPTGGTAYKYTDPDSPIVDEYADLATLLRQR